jgi:ubiquinone/menaquinone biosynthesis C-methylase UbiE
MWQLQASSASRTALRQRLLRLQGESPPLAVAALREDHMDLRNRVVEQFKKPSGAFGHIIGWIMAARGSNRERARWTVDLLQIDPDDRVLELGCGPGVALEHVGRRLQSGVVVGIDHSLVMIKQAARRNREAIATGRVLLRLGGVEDVRVLDGPFTKILSINVIQFMPDLTLFFQLLRTKLAPGGSVGTTYQPRNKNPTRSDAIAMADQMSAAMKSAGLAKIHVEECDFNTPAVCVVGVRPEPDGSK